MKLLPQRTLAGLLALTFITLLAGCQSAYYGAMEKVGYAKRDILVDRVEAAAETQQEVQEEVQVAYEAFNALLNLDSSNLERRYEALNDAYEDSRDKADELDERVAAIESVADALFDEWNDELDQYSSRSLRASSAAKLKETRHRYGQYLRSLRRSQARVEPVLAVFKDHVLYLKHNLNAEKISALKGEVVRFDGEIKRLIADMDRSIADAKAFIKELE